MKTHAVLLSTADNSWLARVYPARIRQRMAGDVALYHEPLHPANIGMHREAAQRAEAGFATWGMPPFDEAELRDYFPHLKIVFYAAGSVQSFARPFLNRGIRVVSAWAANAVPVAEYAVSQIVLANKGFFQLSLQYKADYRQSQAMIARFAGNYDTPVGLLGAGAVGRKVIELLRPYRLDVRVFDPFLADDQARALGVRKAGLADIFEQCATISNHLANNAHTVGMLDGRLFDRMAEYAVFINTGRGAQVVERDLIRALREVPTRVALLDVTDPEPVAADSVLRTMDNVVLTPHIAGSLGREVERMAEYMLEEYARFAAGEPLRYEVTLPMLETMA